MTLKRQPKKYQSYTLFAIVAQVFLFVLLSPGDIVGSGTAVYAADDTDNSIGWPTEFDQPPVMEPPQYFEKTTNPIIQKFNAIGRARDANRNATKNATGMAAVSSDSEMLTPPPDKKKHMSLRNPFKPKPPEKKPLTDEQVTKVGPRAFAPSSDPLFALPAAVIAGDATIPAGFYLAQQHVLSELEHELLFVREGKAYGQIVVHLIPKLPPLNPETPAENQKNIEHPTSDSPIQPQDQKNPAPVPTRITVSVSNNVTGEEQTLTLLLKEGDNLYQSEPLPLASGHEQQ